MNGHPQSIRGRKKGRTAEGRSGNVFDYDYTFRTCITIDISVTHTSGTDPSAAKAFPYKLAMGGGACEGNNVPVRSYKLVVCYRSVVIRCGRCRCDVC